MENHKQNTYTVREVSAVSSRNFLRLLVQTTVTVCWSRPTYRGTTCTKQRITGVQVDSHTLLFVQLLAVERTHREIVQFIVGHSFFNSVGLLCCTCR